MGNSRALRRLAPALLAGSVVWLLLGCTQEPREVPAPDCAVDAQYEFYPIYLPSPNPLDPEIGHWYASGDNNGRTALIDELGKPIREIPAVAGSLAYATAEEFVGDICGHTVGKHFTFGFNHDWGAVGGRWAQLGAPDDDASEYEGFAFWGLSLYDSSVELSWSDIYSANPDTEDRIPETCIPDTIPGTTDPNPDFVDVNGVPRANSCGSHFTRRLMMARSWTLYTIPFSDFIQINRDPRFKPGGLVTSAMRQFSFRVPKDTFVDVSFVNFAWYRKAAN